MIEVDAALAWSIVIALVLVAFAKGGTVGHMREEAAWHASTEKWKLSHVANHS